MGLWKLSANGLARQIATGKATAAEIIDAHLARIDAVNPHTNAIVKVLRDEARAADPAGAPLGPLHGVPFTVEENIDVAGLPTT